MSRYILLQREIDVLKRENEKLASINASVNAPEKSLAGLIEKLQNHIEDREWLIIRARSDIQVFSKTIAELRKQQVENKRIKRRG